MIQRSRLLWINLGLIVAFSICYMEWGKDNASTVIGTEYYILFQKKLSADTMLHPVILLGLAGQILVLISAFRPHKALNITGVVMLAPIVLLILLAGTLGGNLRMIASVIPFLVLCVVLFIHLRKRKTKVHH